MSKVDIAIEKAHRVDGWMSEPELQWLAEQALDKEVVIEVGAYKGKTTVLFGNLAQKVYTVDAWEGNFFNAETKQWEYDPNGENILEIFHNNLVELGVSGMVMPLQMYSNVAFEWLKENNVKADMIFIDGNHEHPVVDQDMLTYKELLKPGGIYCGHDVYAWAAVEEALNINLPGWVCVPNTTIWNYRVN